MWRTEALLTAIGTAAPRACITEADLARLTGGGAKDVAMSCLKLRKHGLLEKTSRGCHRLTDAGRAAFEQGAKLRSGPKGRYTGQAIKRGTLRERAWGAIRLLAKQRAAFTVDDLIMNAVAGGPRERAVSSNLRRYLRALELAGYLQRMPVREPRAALTSNGAVRWRLDRDTGALAPVVSQIRRAVYDQNLEHYLPLSGKRSGTETA